RHLDLTVVIGDGDGGGLRRLRRLFRGGGARGAGGERERGAQGQRSCGAAGDADGHGSAPDVRGTTDGMQRAPSSTVRAEERTLGPKSTEAVRASVLHGSPALMRRPGKTRSKPIHTFI